MKFTPCLSQSNSHLSFYNALPPCFHSSLPPFLPSSLPPVHTSAANNTSDDRESKDEVVVVCRRSRQHMVKECVGNADVWVENEVPRVSDQTVSNLGHVKRQPREAGNRRLLLLLLLLMLWLLLLLLLLL